MSKMTEEEFFAFALAKGWTAPPATSAQPTAPTQPVSSTQLAATVGQKPTMSAPLALPTRPSQPIRQPSAPSRPFAATRPSWLKPTVPTGPAQPAKPAQSAPPLPSSTVPVQLAVSAQTANPTLPTEPAHPTTSTRSTAPARPTGPARVARQAATNSPITGAGPTGRPSRNLTGTGPPPPRKLSTPEIAELHFELNKLMDGVDPFEIKYVDTNPGGRKTRVNVKELLDLSDDSFRVIRKILRTTLSRTPGIDMTQTMNNQGSHFLIIRAIHYALPILPGFEVYKEDDYWPLQCIASRLFRNGANLVQNKQRTKARRELENKGNANAGAGSGAELNAAPTGDPVITSEVDPNGVIGVQPAQLESLPMFGREALVAPGAPNAWPV
ncbi:hypothetical protein BDV93DRAFT_566518, partial [Ceratobasidium sp. AG-I]